ncbi:hypothetical protein PP631_gp060 [Streptomyces phage KimJongPhill]|uniref:Uncharacterized protein n=1 Tax=Streptomyces phage KimJongPhill TaxID=2848886 RepID=A0A8F2IWE0_9CAUD|nr:hypothetical protein PP631_gp060 [Streptomyces phage KimJongPhill]QWT29841.1 hypothetical protein SEA_KIMJONGPHILL_60 [Streptomyces phage KimJongPhill]
MNQLPPEQDPANLTEGQRANIAAAQSLHDDLLAASTVPASLIPEPVVSRVPTYADLMDLIKRIEDTAYDEAPDVFEAARREGETRRQAKSRIMLEHYAREGFTVRDGDLWALRAQYVAVKEYVQGQGGGLPYNTHNWVHFYNRYGMGGQDPVLMVGLRKSTVEEMGRAGILESEARRTLRILGH